MVLANPAQYHQADAASTTLLQQKPALSCTRSPPVNEVNGAILGDAHESPINDQPWVSEQTRTYFAREMPLMVWSPILSQLFFHQVSVPVGWYTLLPQLHVQAPPRSCLRLTVAAASLFLASNQLRDDGLLQRARFLYGAALQAINAALASPKLRLQDETLASILLLNVADDVMGHNSFVGGSHLGGCAELMKLRDARRYRTACTPFLAHSVVIQTQPHLLRGRRDAHSVPLDEPVHQWLWEQTPEAPAAAVSAFCLAVGKVRDVALKLFSLDKSGQSDGTALLSLMQNIVKLDNGAVGWNLQGGAKWIRHSTTVTSAAGKEARAEYYADLQVSKVWNHWRVGRIILHDAVLSAARRLKSYPACSRGVSLDAVEERSLYIIRDMIADILASIPFHFAEISAAGLPCSVQSQPVLGSCALMWPLQITLQCQWISAAQKTHAGEALRSMSSVVGVKQALMPVEKVLCSDSNTSSAAPIDSCCASAGKRQV